MSCSGCGKRLPRPTKGFCESLQIQTKVKLSGSLVLVEHDGTWKPLQAGLIEHSCSGSPGSVLASCIVEALAEAIASGKDLGSRQDKVMPMVLLKHFLYKELGR